jgi:hypothetical protein
MPFLRRALLKIKSNDSVPGTNIHRILLFTEKIDLLGELNFHSPSDNLLVEVCNNAVELVVRAKRFRPDVLLVDQDTYIKSRDFSTAVKVIKAAHTVRVVLLVNDLSGISLDDSVVNETRFISKNVILDLFK